jgi:hypothetical protein
MHSFLIEKLDLDFKENKFLITSLYLHEMFGNSVISLQIMLFGNALTILKIFHLSIIFMI